MVLIENIRKSRWELSRRLFILILVLEIFLKICEQKMQPCGPGLQNCVKFNKEQREIVG